MRKLFISGTIFAFALFAGACSPRVQNSQTTSPTETEVLDEGTSIREEGLGENVESAVIEISNYSYYPASVTVKPGAIISVTNEDNVKHTVTSSQNGLFDTGLIGEGDTVTFTAPTTPGTYSYYCIPHPEMVGNLIVAD